MEREHIAIYLPAPLVARLDAVSRDELRSRANTARSLLDEALRRRDADAQDEAESR